MSGYIGSTPVPQATQHRESFTCTEGQTTFNTAGYTPQFVDVYLNGSHLSPADFTATNGSDVVLGVAASADDVCDIISYTPFEVAGATFTGTTTTDVSLTTGVLTANGGAVFNEGSADVDFRVESDSSTHALFVDGGGGVRVMIGTSTEGQNQADNLTVSDAGNMGMTLRSTNSGECSIFFSDATSGAGEYAGSIQYLHASDSMVFATAGVAKMTIDATGAVTKPLQPAFLARPASQQSNIAINATTTIVFGTEIFDQNADFASNTFTAPVTGKYQLNVQLMIQQMDKDTDFLSFSLVTSNRSYQVYWDNDTMAADSPNGHGINIVVLADMDASDTAYVNVAIPNSGAAQMDVTTSSAFSGYLVA